MPLAWFCSNGDGLCPTAHQSPGEFSPASSSSFLSLLPSGYGTHFTNQLPHLRFLVILELTSPSPPAALPPAFAALCFMTAMITPAKMSHPATTPGPAPITGSRR